MRKKTKKEESSEVAPFLPEGEMLQLQKDIAVFDKSDNMKQVSASSIVGLLGEFFESYIVFAHDLDGNHFVLRKADNSRDMRAITGLVTDYVDGNIDMSPNFSKKNISDIDDWLEKEMLENMDDDEDDDEDFE